MSWMLRIAKKRLEFILVHGWGGGMNKDWFPWLIKKLNKDNSNSMVHPISMPNPSKPDKESWTKHLRDHIEVNKNTIIIAHSIGCMAVIRFLESINEVPKAIILVAPFAENVGEWKTIQSFFNSEINWDKIKRCKNIFTIHSDDDPDVPPDQRFIFRDKASATIFLEHGKGHFNDKKNPKIINILSDLY